MMKRFFSWAMALGLACSGATASAEHCDSSYFGGCDSGCATCDSGFATSDCGDSLCKVRCGHSGWYAGVEATYLAPQYDNGAASFSLFDVAAPGAPGVEIGSNFDTAEELTGAPRVMFGYMGKRGIGIQARYWELNNALSQTEIADPIVGNQIQHLGGEDGFEAYTIDLELTKEFSRRGWGLLGTFGVRHAAIDHTRANRVVGAVNGDVFSLGAQQSEQFNGTGLTSSLSALRPIRGCRGLSLYANLRGSVVFGEADTLAQTSSSFSGAGGLAGSVNGALAEEDEAMFITDIGAGLQWSRCVRGFKSRMFARAGVEYQYWDTSSDGTAFATSFSGTPGSSLGVATARGGDHEFHLIGLAVMTGFNW